MLVETPHIKANKEDFAKIVLMPGDPLRSKMIALNFLENPKLVNDIRGVQGYTGTYKGKKISVMASGMGMPSMGIYSYELFKFFDVNCIIRIGSAGTLNEELKIKDLIIAENTISNSNYDNILEKEGISKQHANKDLVLKAAKIADELNIKYKIGTLYSSDTYYDEDDSNMKYKQLGADAAEMEANALYINAKKFNKLALTICTISNSLLTGEETSAQERQNSFIDMIKVALELAIKEEN